MLTTTIPTTIQRRSRSFNTIVREGYFKGNITISHGRHEIKAGVESDNLFLHENFNYNITDPTQYDPDTRNQGHGFIRIRALLRIGAERSHNVIVGLPR